MVGQGKEIQSPITGDLDQLRHTALAVRVGGMRMQVPPVPARPALRRRRERAICARRSSLWLVPVCLYA